MIRLGYDMLFQIRLLHDYYDGPCPGLTLAPISACTAALADHGLLFKTTPDGGMVLFSATESGQIQRKINAMVRFTFRLILQNPAFDNVTRLSYPPAGPGRRFYYVSNVSGTGAINATTALAKSPDAKVGNNDLGWLVGPAVTIPLGGSFTQVTLSQILPKSGKTALKTFATTGQNELHLDLQTIDNAPDPPIRLRTGSYVLDFAGANPKTELIYFDEQIATSSRCWGLLDIVADETTSYTARTAYTLTFRADAWKYYLIDPSNKVTINNNSLMNLLTTTTGLAGLSLAWVPEADLEADTYDKRRYERLKALHSGKRIFLLRSNRSMTKDAESAVIVKLIIDGVERPLPNPRGNQSKLEISQTL